MIKTSVSTCCRSRNGVKILNVYSMGCYMYLNILRSILLKNVIHSLLVLICALSFDDQWAYYIMALSFSHALSKHDYRINNPIIF